MKKLVLTLTLFLAIFTLSACTINPGEEDPDLGISITLESNIESVNPSLLRLSNSTTDVISVGDQVTASAPDVDGYRFVYWLHKELTIIMSNDQDYTFTVSRDVTLRAIYEEIPVETPVTLTLESNVESASLSASNDTLYAGDSVTISTSEVDEYTFDGWYLGETLISTALVYTFTIENSMTLVAVYSSSLVEQTITLDFEGDFKRSYALDTISLNDQLYILNDALVGSLDNDQKNDSWSLRIRNGYFQPDFTFTYVEVLSFYAGRYLSDNASSLEVLVSFNDNDFISIDSFTVDAFTLYTISFDAVYDLLDLDPSTPIYIRIQSSSSERVNIDDVSITYSSTGDNDPTDPVDPVEEEVSLTLESNISSGVHVNPDAPYYEDDEVTIIAPIIEGYTFEYWLNLSDDSIFTEVPNYTFNITSDLSLRAIYSEIIDPGEPDEVDFTIHPDTVYHYSLGDTVMTYPCEATLIETGDSLTCEIEGSVNTNLIGEYTITYKALSDTETYTYEVTKVVLKDATLLELTLSSYYADAMGLYGEALLIALHNIINEGFSGVTYGESRYILDDSDQDPNNPNNLILLYRQTSNSGTWDNGNTWNREHIWPQSLLGESSNNSVVNIASDLFNLAPANPSENSSRGNKYFFTSTTSDGYLPTEVAARGYVARALFYMMVMYDHLDLVNSNPNTYEMGHLDTLLMWHFMYDVSMLETQRNDVIFTYQNNRNPFIDYPHLVELIYWNHPDVLTWE